MRQTVAAIVIGTLVASSMSGCLWFGSKSPGSAAKDFLSGSVGKLVVEIDSQSGKQLTGTSVDLLRQRINERLNKPGGVTYQESTVGLSRNMWTGDDLRDAEKQNRDNGRGVDTASLYILVVGGSYEHDSSNSKVLGVAYGPSSIAMFKDNINSAGGVGGIALFSPADVEKAVLVHEFGHVLGLVNIGIDMQSPHEMTEDPVPSTPQNEGRGHSSNKASVMYWAVESSLLDQVFNGAPPNQFDANDIADMRAAGGK